MHLHAAAPRRRSRHRLITTLVCAAMAALFLAVVASVPPRVPTLARALPAAWSGSTVPVTVIGDSLSSGYRTPGDPWTLPAQELLDSDGIAMMLTNESGPGSGYAAKGAYGRTFTDYVRLGVTPRTRLVLVFGSDNDTLDRAYPAAVATTLDLIHSITPAALVVVVGPPGTLADPAAGLAAINDVLGGVASAHGAVFIDALNWFAGTDAGYLGPDGEHPDEAGETYLATRFVALLRSLRPGRKSLLTLAE